MQTDAANPHGVNTRANHGERRPKAWKVLEAARKIFLTYGFSAATTDMSQRKAHVFKSTVYAHYQNKEPLFIAML
ncbi:TetR/AcrR family transcriptional regulator [Dickeya sp. NCPPB 3274]|uniref:TetR/AcrR family transcriptional regulator n=1 Tax=Dickeya sp. NCPPB 3274 TaxID=568766 RepID=UPI0003A64649|nr:helix-turn-helix domain-containing protein [Dickeya sp. NCPPB 3274]